MAIFNSSLLFLLLITALLAFIIGWLSRKLTSGDNESVLKQKITVLRNTINEQNEELSGINSLKESEPSYSHSLIVDKPNSTEELVELRLKNKKILDSEKDLKVKLSQLYAKKQAEINRLSSKIKSLKVSLDTLKEERAIELEHTVESGHTVEVELENAIEIEHTVELEPIVPISGIEPLINNDSDNAEIESQKQTIGRLENQLKVEADIYKRRIEELEGKSNDLIEASAQSNDKLQTMSERLATKDAELVAMKDEVKAIKKKKITAKTESTCRPVAKKVSKKKTTRKKVTKRTPAKTQIVIKDDLTKINGIGPKIKTLLYKNDITSFAQIAALKAVDIKILADKLGNFRDRIKRDEWVKQAKKMAK